METFSQIRVVDLHGNVKKRERSPDGKPDASEGSDGLSGITYDDFFKGIWPLDEWDDDPATRVSTDFIKDRSGNVHHGQLTDADGDTARIDSPIFKALNFAGDADHIHVAHHTDLNMGTDDWTIELFVKTDYTDASQNFVLKRDSLNGYFMGQSTGGDGTWYAIAEFDDVRYQLIPNGVPETQWVYLVQRAKRDGMFGLWLNGAPHGTDADISAHAAQNMDNTVELKIGGYSGWHHDGGLAELRISRGIARSDAWLKFTYHNLMENDHELTWGTAVTRYPYRTAQGQVVHPGAVAAEIFQPGADAAQVLHS